MSDSDGGRPAMAEPREMARVVANPLGDFDRGPPHPGALVSVEQQRAIAEVQARMIVARAHPRHPIRCVDQILQDCTRPTLAESALYQYARGGTAISGPSIRLAEAIARRWGNLASGIKEIGRQDGYSECVAYAWDLETGYYDERQFQVRHWRDTTKGGYALKDERDIYELIANNGQRRKRAALLTVIPGDVVEAAAAQCEETLRASADGSPEAIRKMIEAFGEYGITRAQIEVRSQCRAEAIRPAQLVQLRKIYTSLRDGMSEAADWFSPVQLAEPGTAAQPPRGRPQRQADPERDALIAEAQRRGIDIDGRWSAERIREALTPAQPAGAENPPDASSGGDLAQEPAQHRAQVQFEV